jgi:hypothetical protein
VCLKIGALCNDAVEEVQDQLVRPHVASRVCEATQRSLDAGDLQSDCVRCRGEHHSARYRLGPEYVRALHPFRK